MAREIHAREHLSNRLKAGAGRAGRVVPGTPQVGAAGGGAGWAWTVYWDGLAR